MDRQEGIKNGYTLLTLCNYCENNTVKLVLILRWVVVS